MLEERSTILCLRDYLIQGYVIPNQIERRFKSWLGAGKAEWLETWSWMWSVKRRLFQAGAVVVVFIKPHGAERSSWSLLPYAMLKIKLSGVYTAFPWLFRHHERSKSGHKYFKYVICARSKSKSVLVCARSETIDGIQLNKSKCMSVAEIFIGVSHPEFSLIIVGEEWVFVGCYSSHPKVPVSLHWKEPRVSSSGRDTGGFFCRCVKTGKVNPTPCVSGATWSCWAAVVCQSKVSFLRIKKLEAVPGCLFCAAQSYSTGDLTPKSVLTNT